MFQFQPTLGFKIILPASLFQLIVTGKPQHRDNWYVPESRCGSAPKVPARPEPLSDWRMKLSTPHPLPYYTNGIRQFGRHDMFSWAACSLHVGSLFIRCPPCGYQGQYLGATITYPGTSTALIPDGFICCQVPTNDTSLSKCLS